MKKNQIFKKNILKILLLQIKIKNEYSINKGKINTLTLEKDNFPIIIKYQKDKMGIVLIQALFYKNSVFKNKRHFFKSKKCFK